MDQHITQNRANTAPVEVRSAGLSREALTMFDSIARRAFELSKAKGRGRNRAIDNWIRAERELFRPAYFHVAESQDRLRLEVDVHGFTPRELEVDLGPRLITVIGKHGDLEKQAKTGRGAAQRRDLPLLGSLKLPTEIDTEQATAYVNDKGVLQVDVRKVSPV